MKQDGNSEMLEVPNVSFAFGLLQLPMTLFYQLTNSVMLFLEFNFQFKVLILIKNEKMGVKGR